MLTDIQKRVRLKFLRLDESRLLDLINTSQELEAVLLHEGRHADAKRQREQTTLEGKRQLESVQAEIHTLESGT